MTFERRCDPACAAALLGLLASCANSPAGAELRSARPPVVVTAPASVPFRYEVRFEAGRELLVEAHFDAGNDGIFSLDDDAVPFVRQVEVAHGADWRPVSRQENSWPTPCAIRCAIRYRFALREAAESLADVQTAIAVGEVLIAPPSTWLLHPGAAPTHADFELAVDAGPAARFVSAFRPAADGPNRFRAAIGVLDDASFAAFGPLQVFDVPAGDTTVQLALVPEGLGLSSEQARGWISSSAGAVADYYEGHLPARRTLLLLTNGARDETSGFTLGGGGPGVLVRAANRMTPAATREDWIVTHELLHANFPELGRAHLWLSEGLATYVEPIARARVGLLSDARVWRDMLDGMPKGLPKAGDQGLEKTRTWGRTYWGGALFCLMADVELREQTGNQRSLDDVLLAIGKTGASDEDHWPIERVLETAARATGTQVLHELYARLAEHPGAVDLAELFARLGVRAAGDSVVFDEQAPLAKLRQSITARRPG